MENKLKTLLRSKFGHEDYRSNEQKHAIQTMMEGKNDLLCLMPTGSGKSLVYQLPAVAAEQKVTIVVAPLLALINDQLEHLGQLNIKAETLNSEISVRDKKRIMEDVIKEGPATKILYVTPELCEQDVFHQMVTKMVKKDKLGWLVVDESHIVSEWGHDFRPSCLKLGLLREKTGGVPRVALTAIASKRVVDDIIKNLQLRDLKVFKLPSFRSNLFYQVKFKDSNDVSLNNLH